MHVQGEAFVQLLERQSLEALLGQVAAAHPGCTLSLCLEGLQSYLRQALQFPVSTSSLRGSSSSQSYHRQNMRIHA